MNLRWWSIEILDSRVPDSRPADAQTLDDRAHDGPASGGTAPAGPRGTARGWRDSLGNALTEAAITHGAYEWHWHTHTWGVLFEIAFRTDEAWSSYRALPLVTAALDAVPDPAHGLFVHPGRGGSSGKPQPRHPRPIPGAGAAELAIPHTQDRVTATDSLPESLSPPRMPSPA